MKKLAILPCVILLLFSCSKEKSTEPDNTNATIIGKWYYNYYTKDGERYVLDQTFENENCATIKEWYIEFTDNGDFIQFFVSSCVEDSETSQYSIKGNQIFFYGDDGSAFAIADIVKLTNNELVLVAMDEGSRYERHFKK